MDILLDGYFKRLLNKKTESIFIENRLLNFGIGLKILDLSSSPS